MMRFSRNWRALASAFLTTVLFTTLGAPGVADATVATYMDTATMVEQSDMIVEAEVGAQTTGFDKKYNVATTRTALTVKRVLWAPGVKKGQKLTIEQFGGTYEDITTVIHGDAKFQPGEQVIVFLRRGKKDVHYLTAMAQSKYQIKRTGSKIEVHRDFEGLVFYNPGPGQKFRKIEEPPRLHQSLLAELETLIRSIKRGGDQ